MQIVYFGYDLFADVLETLLNMPQVTVRAVYSYETDNFFEFNRRVKHLAESREIPFSTEKITKEVLSRHFDEGCDLAFSAGYIYKIPILDRADFKGVNVHPSLLPIGRGAWPYPCTILRELNESGVTVHKLGKKFDEGDILLQESYAVSPDETLDTLTEKSQAAAVRLVKKLIPDFLQYFENARAQYGGEYWQEPTDADRTITDGMTVAEADRVIRAFGSYGFIYRGEVYSGKKPLSLKLADGEINILE